MKGYTVFFSVVLLFFQFIFLYTAEPAKPDLVVEQPFMMKTGSTTEKNRILFGGYIVACFLRQINPIHNKFMLIAEACNKAVDIFSEEENAELLRLFHLSVIERFLNDVKLPIYDELMRDFDDLCFMAEERDADGKVVSVAFTEDLVVDVGLILDTLYSNGIAEFIAARQAALLSDEYDEYLKFILGRLEVSEHPDSGKILASLRRLIAAEKLLIESEALVHARAYESIITGLVTLYFNGLQKESWQRIALRYFQEQGAEEASF